WRAERPPESARDLTEFDGGQRQAPRLKGKGREIAPGLRRMERREGRAAGRLRASSQEGLEGESYLRQGAMRPPSKLDWDSPPALPGFSPLWRRSRASNRAFFAFVFEVSLRVTAPFVMRNGPQVGASTYSSINKNGASSSGRHGRGY